MEKDNLIGLLKKAFDTGSAYVTCPSGETPSFEDWLSSQDLETIIEKKLEEFNNLLRDQMDQLSLISKVELGDDVIEEIGRLLKELQTLKDSRHVDNN